MPQPNYDLSLTARWRRWYRRYGWISFVLLAPVLFLLALWGWQRSGPQYDLIIENGHVFDGERMLGFGHAIGIRKERIVKIGVLYGARARRRINAWGRVVAPGFIDTHVHVEASMIPSQPLRAPNFVRMGVTTVITGNCGTSHKNLGPVLKVLDSRRGHVNVATLVGHNTVREAVMGSDRADPTVEELEAMRRLVWEAMRGGAVGFSTGLEYPPGALAKRQEIVELARVVAPWKGVYATHLRNEGVNVMASLEEAIETARQANVHLHVSHLKIASPRAWGRMGAVLERLAKARKELPGVTQDVYGYDRSSSSLDLLLPPEFRDMTPKAGKILQDPERRSKLVAGMLSQLRREGFKDYAHASIAWFRDPELRGRSIDEITGLLTGRQQSAWLTPLVEDLGLRSQVQAVLSIFSQGGAQIIYRVMFERDVAEALKDGHTAIGSDSAVRSAENTSSHPRGSGNFPRILAEYSRASSVLALEEALRKMTSLPANIFHLQGRGRLREGNFGDIVVFDPQRIQDRATYKSPLEYPEGIDFVIVNGTIVAEGKNVLSQFPGRVLRNSVTRPPPLPPLSSALTLPIPKGPLDALESSQEKKPRAEQAVDKNRKRDKPAGTKTGKKDRGNRPAKKSTR